MPSFTRAAQYNRTRQHDYCNIVPMRSEKISAARRYEAGQGLSRVYTNMSLHTLLPANRSQTSAGTIMQYGKASEGIQSVFLASSLGISRRHHAFASPMLSRRQTIIMSMLRVYSGLTTRKRPSAISSCTIG